MLSCLIRKNERLVNMSYNQDGNDLKLQPVKTGHSSSNWSHSSGPRFLTPSHSMEAALAQNHRRFLDRTACSQNLQFQMCINSNSKLEEVGQVEEGMPTRCCSEALALKNSFKSAMPKRNHGMPAKGPFTPGRAGRRFGPKTTSSQGLQPSAMCKQEVYSICIHGYPT